MRRRRLFLLLLVIALVAGALVAISYPLREPRYGGRSLSRWVREYVVPDARVGETDGAIVEIGTNAIPYLMEWMWYEPARSKTMRIARINKLLGKIHIGWQMRDNDWIRAAGAASALRRLRPQADRCIPELGRRMNDSNALYGPKYAVEALAGFGAAGLPLLLASLTNGPKYWRGLIAVRIGSMGTDAWSAVPALQVALKGSDPDIRHDALIALRRIDPYAAVPSLPNLLQDPDRGVRILAIYVLGSLGTTARTFMPALTNLLNDRHPAVRDAATNALHKID